MSTIGDLKNEYNIVRMGFLLGALYTLYLSIRTYFIITFYHAIGSFILLSLSLLQFVTLIIYSDKVKALRHLIPLCTVISLIVRYNLSSHIYGTDSIIMSYMGAVLTIKGKNPYTAPLLPWIRKFNLSPSVMTPKMDGSVVNQITYPSINFMIYIPFMLVGLNNIIDINFLLYILSIIFLYIASINHPLNSIIIFPLVFQPYFLDFLMGGVTDIVWILLGMISIYLINKRKTILSAIFLALSIGFKQIAILILPYLIIRLFYLYNIKKIIKKFLLPLLLTFIIVNLPFIVSNPYYWLKGVMAPIFSLDAPMVPHGFGLIRILLCCGINLPRSVYTLLSVEFLMISIFIYMYIYRYFKASCWILILINFLFWWRSFPSYFLAWIPLFLLDMTLPSTIKVSEAHARELKKYVKIILIMFTIISISGCTILIINNSFYIEVESVKYISSKSIEITIINRSNRKITPLFGVLSEGKYLWNIWYWKTSSGRETLQPNEKKTFILISPSRITLSKNDRILIFINDATSYEYYYTFIVSLKEE